MMQSYEENMIYSSVYSIIFQKTAFFLFYLI